jgi:hypothetical protein
MTVEQPAGKNEKSVAKIKSMDGDGLCFIFLTVNWMIARKRKRK